MGSESPWDDSSWGGNKELNKIIVNILFSVNLDSLLTLLDISDVPEPSLLLHLIPQSLNSIHFFSTQQTVKPYSL